MVFYTLTVISFFSNYCVTTIILIMNIQKYCVLAILVLVASSAIIPGQSQKLCSFNPIGFVPASPTHTFTVNRIPDSATPFQPTDFSVAMEDIPEKNHPFFARIGCKYEEEEAMQKMNCRLQGKQQFARVCEISEEELDGYYYNAFGEEPVYICTVPQNHFAILVRFVLKLSNFDTTAGGRWSVFTGLHEYHSQGMANQIIQIQGQKLSKSINRTSLNTFDINNNLRIIPEFIERSLSWVFNSNRDSEYVSNIQPNTTYQLTDQGYLKVIPAGTEFVMGNIFMGTQVVKQTCDRYWIYQEDNCGFQFGACNLRARGKNSK